MTDIKAALKAEIDKMEAACDEIPFGLDEEDEQCLSVMRDALKELVQRDAQIAALEESLNSALITVAKYSGPESAANALRAEGAEALKEHPAIKLCSMTHICDEVAAKLREGNA